MSLSKGAEATRAILKLHKEEALNGVLTVEEVIAMVRERVPGAHQETICRAIVDYGPIGEGPDGLGDMAWMRRADQPQIPGWFYKEVSA